MFLTDARLLNRALEIPLRLAGNTIFNPLRSAIVSSNEVAPIAFDGR